MLTKRNKVLIVDDQPIIIQALKHSFLAKGYEVNVASTRTDALGFLNKIRVDLVLLDMKMPGICVDELTKIVKERYPQAKIILISGKTSAMKPSTSANTYQPQAIDNLDTEKKILLAKTILLLIAKRLCRQEYANN